MAYTSSVLLSADRKSVSAVLTEIHHDLVSAEAVYVAFRSYAKDRYSVGNFDTCLAPGKGHLVHVGMQKNPFGQHFVRFVIHDFPRVRIMIPSAVVVLDGYVEAPRTCAFLSSRDVPDLGKIEILFVLLRAYGKRGEQAE